MELGALRCTARRPVCDSCPVAGSCRARVGIQDAFAAVPYSPKKPAYRYEGSNRYYRGRALACLRDAPEDGVTLRDLGAALREGFTDADLSWVEGIARSLEKDGLAVLSEQHSVYADAAVAESRLAYSKQGSAGDEGPGAIRISLPR